MSVKELLEKFNKVGINEEDSISEFPPFMQKSLFHLGLKKDVNYTVTSDGSQVTFNTPEEFKKAIDHFKTKGLTYKTENKTIILEAKDKETGDYRDVSGEDKLTADQKITGKRVKIKIPNAYGSTGVIMKYDADTDDVLVRVRGANFISVNLKDLEILKDEKDESAIKEINKGAFHRWLGKAEDSPITTADIEKGLHSKDPHVRKMANFAKNAKKWNK